MPGSEPARQAAGERLPWAQRGPRGAEPGIETAEPPGWSRAPIASGTSPRRSPGGLEAVSRWLPFSPPEGLGSLTTTRRRPRPRSHPSATAPCPGPTCCEQRRSGCWKQSRPTRSATRMPRAGLGARPRPGRIGSRAVPGPDPRRARAAGTPRRARRRRASCAGHLLSPRRPRPRGASHPGHWRM
jgi:hypothetical protein